MMKRFLSHYLAGKNLFFLAFALVLFLLAGYFTLIQLPGDGNEWYMLWVALVVLVHLAGSFVKWWKGGRS